MIYLYNTLVVCIMGVVIFLGLRAVSVGIVARSKLKKKQTIAKRRKKK